MSIRWFKYSMRNSLNTYLLAPTITILLLVYCSTTRIVSNDGQGNGSETIAKGYLYDAAGVPAARVKVYLLPLAFNPNSPSIADSLLQTTSNGAGEYEFTQVPSGVYNIEASDMVRRIGVLINNVTIADTAKVVSIGTSVASQTGAVRMTFPNVQLHIGDYVYLRGTTVFSVVDSQAVLSKTVGIDNVPVGKYPSLTFVRNSDSLSINILDTALIMPAGAIDSIAINRMLSKYSARLYLNTTSLGANSAGNILRFPVLIRLTIGNFNFNEAQTDGGDVRFLKSNGVPLPFEIERWDAAGQQAEIWVNVDTVFGNDSTHYVNMYWGVSTGSSRGSLISLSNGPAAFDTANGFQGVWHFAEAGGLTAYDATGNHYNGTVSDTAPTTADGAIGAGKYFNGISNYIRVAGGTESKLNFSQTSPHTISAWVNIDTFDNATHFIAGKSDRQYFLKVYPWPTGGQHWEFTEYYSNEGYRTLYYPAVARTWKFIEGRFDGKVQQLFIDGVLVADSLGYDSDTLVRNYTQDFMIGRFFQYSSTRTQKWGFYSGKIDEICVSSVARSYAWIKLCYMNQRLDDKLVVLRKQLF